MERTPWRSSFSPSIVQVKSPSIHSLIKNRDSQKVQQNKRKKTKPKASSVVLEKIFQEVEREEGEDVGVAVKQSSGIFAAPNDIIKDFMSFMDEVEPQQKKESVKTTPIVKKTSSVAESKATPTKSQATSQLQTDSIFASLLPQKKNKKKQKIT